jgi:crossover junction endodeoxyribonuclease RuvC
VRILGIDPGSAVTGYGVIERRDGDVRCVDCGTIPAGRGALPDRLLAVHEALMDLAAAFHPGAVALENAFLGKNVRSLAILSQTRGALVVAARRAHLPVYEYTPREVKLAVVGTGNASKAQIAYMVSALLHVSSDGVPRDATDSLAVALCHLQRNGARLGLEKAIPLASPGGLA